MPPSPQGGHTGPPLRRFVLVSPKRYIHLEPSTQRHGPARFPALGVADLAQPGEDLALQRHEISLVHLPQLDPHLGRQQLLAQRRLVVHLLVDRRGDLVEDELDAADEEAVDDQHGYSASEARSSLRRMLTKL